MPGDSVAFDRAAGYYDLTLRALIVIPKIWIFRLSVQFVEPRARRIDVKDASSAARRTA